MVMDSLRFWVTTMHVDGFRFDLAPVLSRGDHGFERGGAFFTAIAQDPVLSRVKMIAEPWDVGPGGYQVGSFPRGWMEWNDRFRDVMRGFWLHSSHPARTRGDFALRLCGSSDLYQHRQRRQRPPSESVNYVASHDGFNLRDMVSYCERHNQANGENNADGHGDNLSNNCGVEGVTNDPSINALRARLQRVLLATTLLAQGTPMLCAGDELGHSQKGNNNPYCQDNETTWIDWAQADHALTAFTARVLTLRRETHPLGNQWYSGLPCANGLPDVSWSQSSGAEMQASDWNNPADGVLGCLIGQPGRSKTPLLLLVNPQANDRMFVLPTGSWRALLDTSMTEGDTPALQTATSYPLRAHSLALLQSVPRKG
jgi:glycogen operon protein